MALNDRQRRFVEELAKGSSATQAYIKAGFSENGAGQGAERLLKNVEICSELNKIRTKAAEETGITLENHLTRLLALSEAAEKAEQFSAAIAAEVSRGKAAGLYVDKVEDVTKMAPEQREQRILTLLSNAKRRKQS